MFDSLRTKTGETSDELVDIRLSSHSVSSCACSLSFCIGEGAVNCDTRAEPPRLCRPKPL